MSTMESNDTGTYSGGLLCASDPFWDDNLSWNTDIPTFTRCLRRSVLSLFPCAVLWFFLPVHVTYLKNRLSSPITKMSATAITKLLSAGVLVLLAIMDLAYWALAPGDAIPLDIIEACARILTFLSLIFLIRFELKCGARVSPIQWCCLLLFAILYTVNVYCEVVNYVVYESKDILPFGTSIVTLAFIIVSYGCHFFAEPRPEYVAPSGDDESARKDRDPKEALELDASFPSQLVFSWLTGFAWQGFKRALTFDDLYDLPPKMTSKSVVPCFLSHLNKQRTKPKKSAPKKVEAVEANKLNGGGGDSPPEIKIVDPNAKDTEDAGDNEAEGYGFNVVPSLGKTFGISFFKASILKLIHDLLVFLSPLLLKKIIHYAAGDEQLWKGIMYSVALFVITSGQSVMLAKYFYEMYVIGIWFRSSLTAAIYRKSLKVSPQGKAESTTGEVVNLMSVDVQRMVELMPYINMVWSSPLQIAIALYMLWGVLGPSVMSGFFVMILLIPLNGFIAAKSRQFQLRQMKEKDSRVKSMNEILAGIKIIKLYGWEPSFQDQVGKIRSKEIRILKNLAYLSSGTSFVWSCAPFLVSFVSFATYVLSSEENILDSEKAFVSLSLFNLLRFPLSMLPMIITSTVQASVSVKRINKYLNLSELKEKKLSPTSTEETVEDVASVTVEKADFRWGKNDEKHTLRNIDFNVKKNKLVAVVGTVGSGKSSLMQALLGEMEKLSGEVKVRGSVSYCAQQAWIQNATLKDNVLFHKKFDSNLYEKVLDACALRDDLKTLPGGDMTEIGEKGINLSGGQKHRVALARIVYSDTDICLLDDPLSAVDAHVGKHIFENVIGPNGLLASKTRIFATHAISFLPEVDEILVMKDGQIVERGSYQELLAQKGKFAEYLVEEIKESAGDDDKEVENLENLDLQTLNDTVKRQLSKQTSVISNGTENRERRESKANAAQGKPEAKADDDKDKQYAAEKMETGKVSLKVYAYYAKAMSYLFTFGCVFFFAIYQICSTLSSVWLSYWSNSEDQYSRNNTLTTSNVTVLENIASVNDSLADKEEDDRNHMFLGVYGLFGIGQALAAVFGSLLVYLSTLKGSQTLHDNMLENILRSPLSFFDTTPQGRIINRFGKDVDVLDNVMPMIFRGWITCLLAVASTFLVITYTTPIFLLPITVIMAGYYLVQRIYVASTRQLKRLESVSKSPIFSHFGETLNGAATIRAFNLERDFIDQSEKLVDDNQKANYPSIVANRWLAVRLETVGNLIIFSSSLLAVLGKDSLTPGLVGLSVSYALSVTQTLNWLVRMASEVETNIVAAERLKEYSETKREAEWSLDSDDQVAGKEWPSDGRIEFDQVCARYREGLPLVLNEISFTVESKKKIGIVGRTGAGKSSVTIALFRIIELAGGKITIDGVDISKLGLHKIRNALTIIPQDPVLFSGSLRLNLDPFNKYTDEDLWKTLKLSHLESFVKELKEGLEHQIAEGGENLSVGQRQLICLARALLRKTKILILDEATAAIDLETDDLIQATLREAFKDCTVLTIAHRLSTIMDYDKVLVMKEGQVAEFDEPELLKQNKESIFYSMCQDANLLPK